MKFLKLYLLPIIAGAIACTLVSWAFESFTPQSNSFFIKNFIQSVASIGCVMFLLNIKKNKKKEIFRI